MRKLGWVTAAVVFTTVLSVGAIAAAKGIKISERSEDFTADPLAEETADCAGKRAVAGGFFGEFEPPSPAVIPLISTREDESGWSFRAGDIAGGPGDATAYAYCAKKKKFPKLREGSEEETISSGLDSVTADCPGSRRAISGGFALPDEIILVTTSMRSGRGSWTVEFFSTSPGSVEVEAFVYCAKDVKLKQRSSETTLSSGEQDTEEARCKRNQRVVSGGFDTESNGVTTAAFSSASRRAGKRAWEATALAEGEAQPLNVYAYCLKQPKKK
jgi:hypothetical protein